MTPLPNARGRFGAFGGRYVPETLIPALDELAREYEKARRVPRFKVELDSYLREYVGRPTPLYYAERLSKKLRGAKIYLKREDLCHTGAHKINNTIGQGLLTRRMGKRRVIAETGAGQHGVAVATVAALFGLQCEVYMGTAAMERQALNVLRMRMRGATVAAPNGGARPLDRERQARGAVRYRLRGRPARDHDVSPSGRRRADPTDPFRLGGARLRGGRAGTRLL